MKMEPARLRFAVLMDNAVSRFQEKLRLGINRYLREAGVDVIYFGVGSMNPSNNEDRAKLRLLDMISPREFDGVLSVSTSLVNTGGAEMLKDRLERLLPLPIVSIGPSIIGEPNLLYDNRRGILDIMHHLIEHHGYSRIAYVSGPLSNAEAKERLDAYRSAAEEAGVYRGEDWVYIGNFQYASGLDAVTAFLDERLIDPEVIVCANDIMALGVWNGLGRRDKTIPYDIAVTGYDDYQLARAVSHQFTTIKQSFEELAYIAIQRLHALARGGEVPHDPPLATKLMIRSSCGCIELQNRLGIASKWDEALKIMGRRVLSFVEDAGRAGDERELYREWTDMVADALEEKLPVYELEALLRDATRTIAERENPKTASTIVSNLYSILMEYCGQIAFYDKWYEFNATTSLQSAVDRLQNEINKDLSMSAHEQEFREVVDRCLAQSFHLLRFSNPDSPAAGASPVFSYDADADTSSWTVGPGSWFPPRGRSFVANLIGIDTNAWGYILIDAEIPMANAFDFLRFRFSGISKDILSMSSIRSLNAEMSREIAAHKVTERKLKEALALVEQMSVEDDLTKLRNRRGFMVMAEQQIRYLRRSKEGFFLVYGDLDGLKKINDIWGHAEGDLALKSAADALRESLRESDIIARIGGDEFTALINNANPPNYETIERRIHDVCARKSAELGKPWRLSISLGCFYSSPNCDLSLERMMELADAELYAIKQRKKSELETES